MYPNSILAGYRALDLADEKGAPCGKLLAEMGAQVIRVDRPRESLRQDYVDSGKRSLGLNIESRTGQDLFKRLIQKTDILIETFAPGYLESLQLGGDQVRLINPGLVHASITGFGKSGPYRDYKSSDIVASAMGGQMYVCGDEAGPPLKPFGPQAYFTASLFAASGVLLAVLGRHSSGKGQFIDISVQECVAGTLDHVLVRYFYEGVVAGRSGSLYWNRAFRTFKCQDGYILLSLFAQWETLVELLDGEGMASDLRAGKWLDPLYRQENSDHIIYVLEQWTMKHRVMELVELGQLMHFPWAKVSPISDVVRNPQLNERGYFLEISEPESGRIVKYPGAPCKMSASPWKVDVSLPDVGEANHQIYGEELGLSAAEIRDLEREGVI